LILLAISGLNVGMVLFMSINGGVWLLGRRKQLYLLLPLASIWAYAWLSGLHPPVERAAIMGSVYLAALALGRPRSVVPALAFGAAAMATVDPQVLLQVDFQPQNL
jgi:competence protein ComEC